MNNFLAILSVTKGVEISLFPKIAREYFAWETHNIYN